MFAVFMELPDDIIRKFVSLYVGREIKTYNPAR